MTGRQVFALVAGTITGAVSGPMIATMLSHKEPAEPALDASSYRSALVDCFEASKNANLLTESDREFADASAILLTQSPRVQKIMQDAQDCAVALSAPAPKAILTFR